MNMLQNSFKVISKQQNITNHSQSIKKNNASINNTLKDLQNASQKQNKTTIKFNKLSKTALEQKTVNLSIQLQTIQLPTIKQAQISLQLKNSLSINNLIKVQDKIRQNSIPSSIQQMDLNHKSIVLNSDPSSEDNQKYNELSNNMFIGSNPGLFYSQKSDFQVEQIKKDIIHINNQTQSQYQLQDNGKYQGHLQLQSQKSITIINQPTLDQQQQYNAIQQANISQNNNHNYQTDLPLKQITTKTNKLPSKPLINRHSKDCITKNSPKKQKQFIVTINKRNTLSNRSKYKKRQYSPLADKHLTNFFVSKSKFQYINSNFYQNKSSVGRQQKAKGDRENETQQKQSQLKYVCQSQGFSKISRQLSSKNYKQTLYNRLSTCSNPNLPRKFNSKFQCLQPLLNKNECQMISSRDKHQSSRDKHQNNYKVGTGNTKFSINITPSQKTKKFFNQSLSTFINHNYRPLTSRIVNQKSKNSSNRLYEANKQNIYNTDINSNSKVNINMMFNCDDLAIISSFKKTNQNSLKSKKVKKEKPDALINSKITSNMIYHTKENKNAEQFQKFQKQATLFSSRAQLAHLHVTEQDLYQSKVKVEHFSRLNNLQNQVLQKISVAQKMGVKIPYVKVFYSPRHFI